MTQTLTLLLNYYLFRNILENQDYYEYLNKIPTNLQLARQNPNPLAN
jgi:hypothetical protein